MATCLTLTHGRSKGACKAIGGISDVWITTSDNITGYTYSGSGATEAIDGITLAAGAPAEPFFAFPQIQESASFTMTPTASIQNASLFFESIITLQFANYDAGLRYVVKELTYNNLVVVAKTLTGQYVLLGEFTGVDVNGGSGQSGQAAGDLNGFTLELRAISPAPPSVLDPTYISTFESLISTVVI